jgi:hypothetical protein
MGTYGAIYVNGEDKDYYIMGDAYPSEVIDFLRDILKDAKTSKDVIHAIYDEIQPLDSWIVEGVGERVDYTYTIDIENDMIITELCNFDPERAKNKDMVLEEINLGKEEYGTLGEIKVEKQPDGGIKIMLYSKINGENRKK